MQARDEPLLPSLPAAPPSYLAARSRPPSQSPPPRAARSGPAGPAPPGQQWRTGSLQEGRGGMHSLLDIRGYLAGAGACTYSSWGCGSAAKCPLLPRCTATKPCHALPHLVPRVRTRSRPRGRSGTGRAPARPQCPSACCNQRKWPGMGVAPAGRGNPDTSCGAECAPGCGLTEGLLP